jgi:hypothetical protein
MMLYHDYGHGDDENGESDGSDVRLVEERRRLPQRIVVDGHVVERRRRGTLL